MLFFCIALQHRTTPLIPRCLRPSRLFRADLFERTVLDNYLLKDSPHYTLNDPPKLLDPLVRLTRYLIIFYLLRSHCLPSSLIQRVHRFYVAPRLQQVNFISHQNLNRPLRRVPIRLLQPMRYIIQLATHRHIVHNDNDIRV